MHLYHFKSSHFCGTKKTPNMSSSKPNINSAAQNFYHYATANVELFRWWALGRTRHLVARHSVAPLLFQPIVDWKLPEWWDILSENLRIVLWHDKWLCCASTDTRGWGTPSAWAEIVKLNYFGIYFSSSFFPGQILFSQIELSGNFSSNYKSLICSIYKAFWKDLQ